MTEESVSIACMVLFKNEREHLERVVPKLVAAFDAVVCVTNREPNTDGSDELLSDFGIEPLRMAWVEDFAAARQFGLDHSSSDYTMWIDSDDDLITDEPSYEAAGLAARRYLADTRMDYYLGRIYHENRAEYWERENWFHRDSGVRVRYPVHETYECRGSSAQFPPGILDRVNAPLTPDYPGKLWRYFDILSQYAAAVDAHDPRIRFYLAREFRGPHSARSALYLDFLSAARADTRYHNFAEEWLATFHLYDMRKALRPARLVRVGRDLVERYPDEFLANVVNCMIECEFNPHEEAALQFRRILQDRDSYARGLAPWFHGWYFARSLNACGHFLHRVSVRQRAPDMAELAVEVLAEASDESGPDDVMELVSNNLAIAQRWLRSLRDAEPLGD